MDIAVWMSNVSYTSIEFFWKMPVKEFYEWAIKISDRVKRNNDTMNE